MEQKIDNLKAKYRSLIENTISNRNLIVQKLFPIPWQTEFLEANSKIVNSIYETLNENELTHFPKTERKMGISYPSIEINYIVNFFDRYYDLNSNQWTYNDFVFQSAFQELEEILNSDKIEVTTYHKIDGVSSKECVNLILNDNFAIKTVDSSITKRFLKGYGADKFDFRYTKDSVYIEAKFFIEKHKYKHTNHKIKTLVLTDCHKVFLDDKLPQIFYSLIATNIGNISLGKQVYSPNNWMVVGNDFYPNKYTTTLYINSSAYPFILKPELKNEICFFYDYFNLLNDKIVNSFYWLSKSKSNNNISNKVLYLAIAIEFVFNVRKETEIATKITLRIIKLFNENNVDFTLSKKIKKFYNLRSDIVHGANNLMNSDNKSIELFKEIEEIFLACLKNFVARIKEGYSYEEIFNAIDFSFESNIPYSSLLKEIPLKWSDFSICEDWLTILKEVYIHFETFKMKIKNQDTVINDIRSYLKKNNINSVKITEDIVRQWKPITAHIWRFYPV